VEKLDAKIHGVIGKSTFLIKKLIESSDIFDIHFKGFLLLFIIVALA